MQIRTTRFGLVEVDDRLIITLVSPIIGFGSFTQYVLLDHSNDSPFKWFQSIEEPSLAFVVTHPGLFGREYAFSIPDEVVESLDLTSEEDVLVLCIANIPDNTPQNMTINMLGPVIINQNNRKGLQLVLNDTDYTTREPIMEVPQGAATPTPIAQESSVGERG